MKSKSSNKIVWAANPYDKNPELMRSVIHLLKNFERIKGTTIEPVFVGNSSAKTLALKTLQSLISKSGLKKISAPIFIEDNAGSTRSAVASLTRYCKSKNISTIVVATHARKGFPRLMMGSFAETLLLSSPIPLAFVNPSQGKLRDIQSVLFPTDLAKGAKKSFLPCVELAAKLSATISIFSSLNLSQRALLRTEDIGGFSFPMWVSADEAAIAAQALIKSATASRVQASFVHRESPHSVVDSVVRELKIGKHDLLVIATQAIPKIPLLIGSHTRQLVRQATCPVYVYRS